MSDLLSADGAARTCAPIHYRHAYLVSALAAMICLPPFFPSRVLGLALIEGLLFLALLAGVYSTAADRRRSALATSLALVALAARLVWDEGETGASFFVFLASYLAFFTLVGVTLLTRLFRPGQLVSADTLCGAASVYLILGVVGTCAYALLESAVPGSFTFAQEAPLAEERFERFLGFSFATLTTLGYGNVSPATPRADALATAQAVAGQFYVAVVVARFVALQLAQGRER
ncbi:MAG: ion channel [Planctomycetota bacterium]